MLIVSQGEEEKLKQIAKQLQKLYDVKFVETIPYDTVETKDLLVSILNSSTFNTNNGK